MTEATEQKVAVRAGTTDDLPRLSDVLARSFETCPAWGWYLPPESKNRVDRMQAFFAGLLREVYLQDGRGVDPKAKRGVADALLTRVLDRCDSEGMSAYLETGRPKSRDFFQRFGFEVTEELRLPGDGPTVWRMWREPTEGN